MERIASAAIHVGGIICSMPSPARHHSIISNAVYSLQLTPPFIGEQGFITSTGRFVNRKEAKHIAVEAGQIRDGATLSNPELFSEDLW